MSDIKSDTDGDVKVKIEFGEDVKSVQSQPEAVKSRQVDSSTIARGLKHKAEDDYEQDVAAHFRRVKQTKPKWMQSYLGEFHPDLRYVAAEEWDIAERCMVDPDFKIRHLEAEWHNRYGVREMETRDQIRAGVPNRIAPGPSQFQDEEERICSKDKQRCIRIHYGLGQEAAYRLRELLVLQHKLLNSDKDYQTLCREHEPIRSEIKDIVKKAGMETDCEVISSSILYAVLTKTSVTMKIKQEKDIKIKIESGIEDKTHVTPEDQVDVKSDLDEGITIKREHELDDKDGIRAGSTSLKRKTDDEFSASSSTKRIKYGLSRGMDKTAFQAREMEFIRSWVSKPLKSMLEDVPPSERDSRTRAYESYLRYLEDDDLKDAYLEEAWKQELKYYGDNDDGMITTSDSPPTMTAQSVLLGEELDFLNQGHRDNCRLVLYQLGSVQADCLRKFYIDLVRTRTGELDIDEEVLRYRGIRMKIDKILRKATLEAL
ncbi:Hypothetical protein D9617_26g079030 [Elsinoe fawcettii]|nr:Hypothetical protein D9617_26g079030 [Elsinoe fawcettii]